MWEVTINERISIAAKAPEAKSQNSVPQIRRKTSRSMNSPVDRILFLQRTIGNQAVARLIKSGALQTKLRIGQPGDKYEQEADRVAEQVMRMPMPLTTERTGASGQAEDTRIQRKCLKCMNGLHGLLGKDKKDEKLQAKQTPGRTHEITAQIESNINALRGGGQPLPEPVRAFFEPRFGHDFGQVRVHSDAAAEQSAWDVNAHAYTVGRDIVFGAGRFAPGTHQGRQLIAHELMHVVQQSGADGIHFLKNDEKRNLSPISSRAARTFRLSAAPTLQVARQAAPAFGDACKTPAPGGPANPCQLARCSPAEQATAVADLARGLGYVNASITALTAAQLSGFTLRAIDWYFGGHDAATVATIRTRLGCIATSLMSAPGRYGCHPNYNALAYTCAGGAGLCGHLAQDICFTSLHFDQNPRERAITAIHEAAHLEGMSTGSPRTNPDIYENEMRFLDISPSQAVQNSDSYALFAAAIGTNDLPSTILLTAGAGGGLALTTLADPTWYFQGTLGLEYQHPRLRVFHPTLNLGFTLIGEAENPRTGIRASKSTLTSVLAGLRIGRARRPGAGGALELSLFGGPALSLREGSKPQVGAVAGISFGYRWRMLDFSLGAGYAYDPRRSEAGIEHTAMVGGTFTINLH